MKELAVRTDQAWFAHVACIRPHDPFIAPEPYNRLYRADEIPPPARMPTPDAEAAVHPFLAADLAGFDMINAYHDVFNCHLDNEDPRDVATLRAVYFGLANELDHHVGRLIRFLKDTGQYDNTLIIFTADHGEMLGDRRQWGKVSVYDAATRVPLIIRDPRRRSCNGGQFDAFTESVDVSPTILDWLAGEVPAAMNGASLLPWLEGNAPPGWRDMPTPRWSLAILNAIPAASRKQGLAAICGIRNGWATPTASGNWGSACARPIMRSFRRTATGSRISTAACRRCCLTRSRPTANSETSRTIRIMPAKFCA